MKGLVDEVEKRFKKFDRTNVDDDGWQRAKVKPARQVEKVEDLFKRTLKECPDC